MKKALVLAGGIAQAALISELKSRGYKTLLADMNADCYAAPYADVFCPVSAMDYEGLLRLAEEQRVDMVITACADQILLAETWLNERLGLTGYISHETAKQVSDKQLMKEVFVRHDIPTSRFVILDAYAPEKISHLRFPVIVKPVDAYSSRGVAKCAGPEEVKPLLEEAIRISRTKTAIVEEYKEGTELTVEFFVLRGKAHLLCYGSKEKLKNGTFVSYGSLYPSNITEALREKIETIGQQIADAFGLVNSPMLVQMITDGTDAFVLEFCARTGGFIKYEIVRKMSGFDPIGAVVDLHEGRLPEIGLLKPEKNYLISCFLYCSSGVLDRYGGFEEAKQAGFLSAYWQVRRPGYEFRSINSNGDRAACFLTQDDTLEGLAERYAKARSMVQVLDSAGSNLIRFDLM